MITVCATWEAMLLRFGSSFEIIASVSPFLS